MATKSRSKKRSTGRKRAIVVVGKKHRRTTKRRVSGTVGRTHHRSKKRGSVGAIHAGNLKAIGTMAVGVGVGAFGTHMVLRPLAKKLVEKYPMAGKFVAAAEILIGGTIALKAKHPFMKSVGIGILAGGVHAGMKQLNIHTNIPGIHGNDDYQTVKIPMSGDIAAQVAGILKDGRRTVRTAMVADTEGIGYDKEDYDLEAQYVKR